MNTTTRTRTAIATVLLALALPITLSACSAGEADAAGGDAQQSTGIGAKWGSCMRDAGFDVQDPPDEQLESGAVTQREGVDEQAWNTASNRCSATAGVQRADTAQQQKWARQYAQVASCIRDNGYEDYPEQPEGSIGVDPETYPRAAEPQFDETFRKCLAEYAPDTKMQERG